MKVAYMFNEDSICHVSCPAIITSLWLDGQLTKGVPWKKHAFDLSQTLEVQKRVVLVLSFPAAFKRTHV